MKNTDAPELRSDCPISFTLDLIGDKWTLLIMRDMIFFGMRTYSEILNSREKIASNIARDRLKKLTASGFIEIGNSHSRKWKRPYIVTEKGMELIPVIINMARFGLKYGPDGGMGELIRKGEKDPAAALEGLKASVRKVNENYLGDFPSQDRKLQDAN